MRGGLLSLSCCCCSSTATTASRSSFLFPPKPIPTVRSLSVVSTADAEVSGETTSVAGRSLPSRRLILLRHAESAAPARFFRDHDRPLSKAGREDAISVSVKLEEMGWVPQLILSSDAARTKETLQIMQEHAHGFSEAKVFFMPSFYSIAAMDGQTADHLQSTICEYSTDEIDTVMCMGHNRGWEEAASMFCGTPVELKTCNAALLEAIGNSWTEAFIMAGAGGWRLHGILKPNSST
ncbi:uncharacterized protein M6B38_366650 [Iris pallida]|uniref:Uncharacterized protein n=1 Tax=Iris pallida TaxID=29817 RepID=A0AAX6F2D2_IRIPA|nr:uncharacterized protein M6B38_156700 [Iris pallida]KAJ6827725.1 uncharacterized protein M6B38_366650 [Iris pallida]